jgi:hypothetical protein
VQFLEQWRYLVIDDGRKIYGFDHDGVYLSSRPWISHEHSEDNACLVIGDCFQYADGDQLIVRVSGGKCDQPVLLYLHEAGPKTEVLAPSFSLALWRLVHEELEGEEWDE